MSHAYHSEMLRSRRSESFHKKRTADSIGRCQRKYFPNSRLSTLAAVAVILVTLLFGHVSDLLGRKVVLGIRAACCVLFPIGIYALMASGSPMAALLGALFLAGLAGGVSAVSPAASAEQFPGEGRLSGLAVSATVATTVFGGFTPYVAQILIESTGWALVPGAMIAAVALCVLPVLLTMRETAPHLSGAEGQFGQRRDGK